MEKILFNNFEKPFKQFYLYNTATSMKIIPKEIDQNYNIICKEFSVEVPKYFKNLCKEKTPINQRKLDKYEGLVLGEHGIPMFRLKNNKIINFYEDKNISNNETIIFAQLANNNNKISNNDLILVCIGSGMHLCNLPLLKFIFEQNKKVFQNKLFNNQTPLEYIFNTTIKLPYTKILSLVSNGLIKKIITSKENIINDLSPHIPNGLRANIHSNLWGLDTSLKDLLSMCGYPSNFGYSKLNANAAYYFIIDQKNLKNICQKFNNDFNQPLISIGTIREGNRGNKVTLHLY